MQDKLISRAECNLEPCYDARKSFYGKAVVIKECYTDCSVIKLRSYSTIVAEIKLRYDSIELFCKAYVYSWYSGTTGRHIKEFLKQYGFHANNKAQILRDYGVEEE